MTKSITFGSVCSGIEAASCAWESLGWEADWLAEIEPFPASVLAERFPTVPNLGDMTKIADMVQSGAVSAPDVLVGGTPCQAYSIAGARKGLADDRGLLTLKYIELADEIDRKRAESGHQPAVIVWENVPGVLSMPDNAFGHFIAGLAGGNEAAEPGNRPEHGKSNIFWRWNEKTGSHVPKWTSSGCVTGPVRQVAWRVLDAQYFGVAQRRRRIFVVASARPDIDPRKVLFESEGMCRDTESSDERGRKLSVPVNGGTLYRFRRTDSYIADTVTSTLTARDHKGPRDFVVTHDGRVRSLIPEEYEILQGFPLGHTNISGATPGKRIKALGNSMAVPVMRWIGERIQDAISVIDNQKVTTVQPPKKQVCCSISGGRTSAYMALKLVDIYGKDNVAFIFTDTGAEHPKTYEFLRDISAKYGIKITCLRLVINPELGKGNSYTEIDLSECQHDLKPWKDACSKYGTPYLGGPFCTRTMKLEVFNRYCNATFGNGNYHTWLGIRSDEPKRLKVREGISYLADIDDAEKPDVLEFWRNQPIDLQIPEHLGNCVFCIKKGLNKIALAARDEPELLIQFLDVIESPSVRTVERRQQENKIMYRDNMSLRSIVETYKDHSREEIAATIRGMKGEDAGSCSESCEAMLDETPALYSEEDSQPVSVTEHKQANSDKAIKMANPGRKRSKRKVSVATEPYIKPFLKWVGGKFLQLDYILPLLQGHQRLIEPFAGGGSVFLNAGFKTALINDNCSDLINTYQQLKIHAHDVITKAHRLFRLYNTQEGFLRVREKFNAGKYTPAERAAVFIYLNRHCFNGLIRYNSKGLFNVGYGKYDSPYFPLEEMENFIGCSEGIIFTSGDYSSVVAQAGPGDVLFCDPPYDPLPGKDGFTQYSNAGAFRLSDQIRLADLAVEAHQRGATVIITNSGADSLRDAYSARGFAVSSVSVKRSMSSCSGARKRASDIIAILRGSD